MLKNEEQEEGDIPEAEINRDGLQYYLRELRHYPVIKDPEKIAQLVDQWRNHGDLQARSQLICSNYRLVVKIAHSHANQGVPLPDLIQEGFLGLMRALDKFDTKLGGLATYANWWITLKMERLIGSISDKHPFNLEPLIDRRVKLVARAMSSFFNQFGWLPNDQEIHTWIHTTDGTEDETKEAKSITIKMIGVCQRILTKQYIPLDSTKIYNMRQPRTYHEVIADQKNNPERILESREELRKYAALLSRFEKEIYNLKPQEGEITRALWLKGMAPKVIGELMGISRQRVDLVGKIAIKKIGSKLKVDYIVLKQLLENTRELLPNIPTDNTEKKIIKVTAKKPTPPKQITDTTPPTATTGPRMPRSQGWSNEKFARFFKKTAG